MRHRRTTRGSVTSVRCSRAIAVGGPASLPFPRSSNTIFCSYLMHMELFESRERRNFQESSRSPRPSTCRGEFFLVLERELAFSHYRPPALFSHRRTLAVLLPIANPFTQSHHVSQSRRCVAGPVFRLTLSHTLGLTRTAPSLAVGRTVLGAGGASSLDRHQE